MKALKTNRIVNSPAYPKILEQYSEWLQRNGKVNAKEFFERIVSPEIPGITLDGWYYFLKRFKTENGIMKAEIAEVRPEAIAGDAEEKTVAIMLSNDEATRKLIQATLNISATAAQEIIEHPEKLSTKERLELGLKAMKAQDSRIHAIGKIREDKREQDKFERAFSDAVV